MTDWAKAKSGEQVFKKVEAYDSSRLEQWIREAPAVGLWLAKQMGMPAKGVTDVTSHWLDVQASLRWPISPEILLVTREALTQSFQKWLDSGAEVLAVALHLHTN